VQQALTAEVTLRVLTLQASAHKQPVVPAEGGRGRAAARLSDLGAWLPLLSRTRPEAARHAQPGYMLTSHSVQYTHAKVVTAARLASHTFIYRQNEPSLPYRRRRRPPRPRGAGGAAARRITHVHVPRDCHRRIPSQRTARARARAVRRERARCRRGTELTD